jgi:hypothetical protein
VVHNFIPFFNGHPLFQEIPPAVCSAIDNFVSKNPNFEIPSQFQKVVALDVKIKDILNTTSTKWAGSVPSAPRSDRIKKTKPAVSLLFRVFIFLAFHLFHRVSVPVYQRNLLMIPMAMNPPFSWIPQPLLLPNHLPSPLVPLKRFRVSSSRPLLRYVTLFLFLLFRV